MIVDIEANKNYVLQSLNCHLILYHNLIPKCLRVGNTLFFLMKIPNKKELQRIASNHFTGERTIRKGCYNQEYSPLGSNLEKKQYEE